ncbi:unnamed protein product [Hyaloperonospora brassicae]|uniref:RxLR effector candidate protein n=1 Tax=Hyaloperonospora brassicae TaxID=162125 RepID=A0AAV0UUB8_HYABA|nr:unnamed protein product [Hyaloperonospora brassicae]
MRVCYFILLPAVARAVTTTSVSVMSNPITPLAHLTEIAELRDGVLVNGTMKAGEVGNREERVLNIRQFLDIETLVGSFAQQKMAEDKFAAVERLLIELTEVKVEGLLDWYRVANKGATPEEALGSALADTYGDDVMAQALVRASIKKKAKIGAPLEAVKDAMIACWNAEGRTTNEVLQWLERDKPSSDKDLFDYGIAKLLTGADTVHKHVAEVLLDHFEGEYVRFFVALVRAEKKETADESVMKACWD